MTRLAGGCACGAVRYESDDAPQTAIHCQCRACQRTGGGGHSSLLILPAAGLRLTGELRFYERASDHGNTVSSGFCPTCGSPVMALSSGYPDLRFVHAGSLDEPAAFTPGRVVWSADGQPWDHIDPALPRS